MKTERSGKTTRFFFSAKLRRVTSLRHLISPDFWLLIFFPKINEVYYCSSKHEAVTHTHTHRENSIPAKLCVCIAIRQKEFVIFLFYLKIDKEKRRKQTLRCSDKTKIKIVAVRSLLLKRTMNDVTKLLLIFLLLFYLDLLCFFLI